MQDSPAVSLPWYRAGGVSVANVAGAYLAKGAASLAASYFNLANPSTNDLTVGVAPTFNTATGWTFNGTSQYLKAMTGVNINWSAVVRYSGATRFTPFGASNDTTTRKFLISLIGTGGSQGIQYANEVAATAAPTPPAAAVIGLAGNQGYRNGVADGSALSAGSGNAVARIYIGCWNLGDLTPTSYFAGNILAAAFYNSTLTAAQMLAISTAMAAL